MKVMIVTGGSRGIGAAIVRRAANDGWAVAINYQSAVGKAQELVRELTDGGKTAIAIKADVGREEDVERLFKQVDTELGPVGALVNNAAIDHSARVVESKMEDLHRVFATNVFGPWMCARAAIARMSQRTGGAGGVIINVSTGATKSGGLPYDVMYTASKGAIETFTLGLARELGKKDGIRVVGVRPGITRTEMFDDYHLSIEKMEEVAQRMTAMGRMCEPLEVANTVVWLASAEASYMTGMVDVTGGLL